MQWDWIPNAFYDLLARVAPGGLVLFAAFLVVADPDAAVHPFSEKFATIVLGGFGPFTLALLLAYITGLVLAELWRLIVAMLYKGRSEATEKKCRAERLRQHLKVTNENGLMRPKLADYLRCEFAKISSSEIDRIDRYDLSERYKHKLPAVRLIDFIDQMLPETHVMYDYLRAKEKGQATRVLKLRSEEKFCDVVAFGFFLLSILNIYYILFVPHSRELLDRLVLLSVLLISAIACYFRGRRMQQFFVSATCTAWFHAISSEETAGRSNGDRECQ